MLDKLPIRQLPIKKLRRDPIIKRSADDIRQIIASTKILKFLPLLIDNHRNILLGHGRLDAAIAQGAFQVPVVRCMEISREQRCALVIAERRFALRLDNRDTLQRELTKLRAYAPELLAAVDHPSDNDLLSEDTCDNGDDPRGATLPDGAAHEVRANDNDASDVVAARAQDENAAEPLDEVANDHNASADAAGVPEGDGDPAFAEDGANGVLAALPIRAMPIASLLRDPRIKPGPSSC